MMHWALILSTLLNTALIFLLVRAKDDRDRWRRTAEAQLRDVLHYRQLLEQWAPHLYEGER